MIARFSKQLNRLHFGKGDHVSKLIEVFFGVSPCQPNSDGLFLPDGAKLVGNMNNKPLLVFGLQTFLFCQVLEVTNSRSARVQGCSQKRLLCFRAYWEDFYHHKSCGVLRARVCLTDSVFARGGVEMQASVQYLFV